MSNKMVTVVSSVCCFSVAQSCPTLCDPMDCSRPGLPVHHQLPELAQTRWVGDAIQPSRLLDAIRTLPKCSTTVQWVIRKTDLVLGLICGILQFVFAKGWHVLGSAQQTLSTCDVSGLLKRYCVYRDELDEAQPQLHCKWLSVQKTLSSLGDLSWAVSRLGRSRFPGGASLVPTSRQSMGAYWDACVYANYSTYRVAFCP